MSASLSPQALAEPRCALWCPAHAGGCSQKFIPALRLTKIGGIGVAAGTDAARGNMGMHFPRGGGVRGCATLKSSNPIAQLGGTGALLGNLVTSGTHFKGGEQWGPPVGQACSPCRQDARPLAGWVSVPSPVPLPLPPVLGNCTKYRSSEAEAHLKPAFGASLQRAANPF